MALETTTVISKWTGPRTAAGKAVCSMNALKHGLTSRRVVMPYENQAEFDALLKDSMEESQPAGTLEIELVNDIAATIWRLSRARRRECDLNHVQELRRKREERNHKHQESNAHRAPKSSPSRKPPFLNDIQPYLVSFRDRKFHRPERSAELITDNRPLTTSN
jgi:hypothetical protein